MIVFKTLIRLAHRTKKSLIMPLIIFVGFIFLSQMNVVKTQERFEMHKPAIAIINDDTSGDVSNALMDYLEDRVTYVDIDRHRIDDAIYYHEVSFVLIIPDGFSESLSQEKTLSLQSKMVLESADGYLIESQINEYLSNVKAFIQAGFSRETAIDRVYENNIRDTSVTILNPEQDYDAIMNAFSHMELYPMMLTVCTIITTLLVVFNSIKIRTRSSVSATSNRSQNLQLFGATLFIGHILWFFLKGISLFFLRDYLVMETLGLRLLNSYVFFLFTLSFSFFVSKIAVTSSSRIAILNASTLGLSFLSGVFVPRSYLDGGVQAVSKFFPLYWNVEISERITLGQTGFNDLLLPILIQLGFAIMFVVIGAIIAREKRFRSVSNTVNTH